MARVVMRDRGGHGAVAEQVVAHVQEGLAERLVHEQAAKAGAVHEQICGEGAPLPRMDRTDRTIRCELHPLQLVYDVLDTPTRSNALQVVRDPVRVKMPGVIHGLLAIEE